jgi:H+/gluconate symporter-like permease
MTQTKTATMKVTTQTATAVALMVTAMAAAPETGALIPETVTRTNTQYTLMVLGYLIGTPVAALIIRGWVVAHKEWKKKTYRGMAQLTPLNPESLPRATRRRYKQNIKPRVTPKKPTTD